MARAITSGEKTLLESDGQATRLFVAVLPARTVFACQVNGAPDNDDKVALVSYDNVSEGSYGDVLADMTCLVGSTAGGNDVGICRVRKTPTADTLYLGETSDIEWEDDLYLTVIEDWNLWAKHVRLVESGGAWTAYMDYDVAYDDQHENFIPVPVLGGPVVVKLTGATVDVDCFDASDSYVFESSISSYSWTCSTAFDSNDTDTATPTFVFDAAGWHRVSCTVTAANGRSFTGHRWVYVYDDENPPMTVFELGEYSGAWDRGGWSFRITAYAEATQSEIRNRALCILFAEDFFQGERQSVGVVVGRENVLAVGWIAGESITWDPHNGMVEFEAQGPQWWMGHIEGFPSGMDDVGTGSPSAWTEMQNATVDRCLYHLIHWRTTATRMMDVRLTDNTTPIGMFNAGRGTLWRQLVTGAQETILAHPCCDKLGRLFAQVDSQYVPVADRSSIPIVMDIEKDHWRDRVQIERRIVQEVNQLDLSGVVWDSTELSGTAVFSLAPGHVMKQYGSIEQIDRLALQSQSQANALAGLIIGQRNNPYPNIGVPLAMNARGVWDVCPRQYGQITISEGDTPRGITLDNFKIIPRRISGRLEKNDFGQILLIDVDFEGETTEETAIDGDPPPDPPGPGPPIIPWEPETEDEIIGHNSALIACSDGNTNQILVTFNVQESWPTWYDAIGNLSNIEDVGTLVNVVVSGQRAYAATHSTGDDYNNSGMGLWYCSDITAAMGGSVTWTLIVSELQAHIESGLDAKQRFGALAMIGQTVCALVHYVGSLTAPDVENIAYIGSGASLSAVGLGYYTSGGDTARPFFNKYDRALFCAWADGIQFYIGGTARHSTVIYGGPGGFSQLMYDDRYSLPYHSIGAGFMTLHVGLDTVMFGPGWSTDVYEPSASRCAIHSDGAGNIVYVKGDNLYENGELIGYYGRRTGAGGSGFGGSIAGGMASYLNSVGGLLWVARSEAVRYDSPMIVLSRYLDGERIWESKTSNAYDVLGGNWVGENGNLNAVVRPFSV